MLDHIGFPVSDYARSKAFYEKALAPLGYRVVMEVTPEQSGGQAHAGFGDDRKPYFWIGTGTPLTGLLHVAFVANNRAAVDAFYRAALAASGKRQAASGKRQG
jgi:catechol 2,3-dioxygenase-like lactoylglutathione lyase family enzyme